jgi:hypothetical protein
MVNVAEAEDSIGTAEARSAFDPCVLFGPAMVKVGNSVTLRATSFTFTPATGWVSIPIVVTVTDNV